MTGQVPSQDTRYVARRLFAKVIDNDSGPRIETLLFKSHSYAFLKLVCHLIFSF